MRVFLGFLFTFFCGKLLLAQAFNPPISQIASGSSFLVATDQHLYYQLNDQLWVRDLQNGQTRALRPLPSPSAWQKHLLNDTLIIAHWHLNMLADTIHLDCFYKGQLIKSNPVRARSHGQHLFYDGHFR
jgi:hypothetical protein